jgi:hypothetical protein
MIWGYNTVQGDEAFIKRTVETAICQGDYVIDPLLELGANVNVGTVETLQRSYYRQGDESILDWVVHALETHLPKAMNETKEEITALEKAKNQANIPRSKLESWKEYFEVYRNWYDPLTDPTTMEYKKKVRTERLNSLMKKQAYLEHVRPALELAGAKTWKDIDRDDEHQTPIAALNLRSRGSNQPNVRYRYLSPQHWRRFPVPETLNGLYDELFEAAFRGDDAKIERLCTTSAELNAVPLQITVEAKVDEYRLGEPSSRRLYEHRPKQSCIAGPTPFYAAVIGNRWSTAKFIIGIAAAQYEKKDDKDEHKLKAALFDLGV